MIADLNKSALEAAVKEFGAATDDKLGHPVAHAIAAYFKSLEAQDLSRTAWYRVYDFIEGGNQWNASTATERRAANCLIIRNDCKLGG